MKFLQIKSIGEMELEAISLIGASTKRGDDDSIGMFGSGLKYSVAALMRQDIPFLVFSGGKEIKITTKEIEFGGKTFNRIFINNEPTSLTDSMGTEDWDGVFPFIREIYSNAMDADENATIELTENIDPENGYTTFCINATPEITDLMKNFKEYFTDSTHALYADKLGEIHAPREVAVAYRRGILAHKGVIKSIFSYNNFEVDINESRVVKNIHQLYKLIGIQLENCQDKRILRRWINGVSGGNAGLIEHKCILDSWNSTQPNPVFVEVILEEKYYAVEGKEFLDEKDIAGRIGLPMKLLKRFIKYAPDVNIQGLTDRSDGLVYFEKEPSVDLFEKSQKALERLKETKYAPRLKNPIKYCAFSDSDVFGLADKEVIWLSIKLDTYSVDEIAKIIIEEQEHLTTGWGDQTRNFQNHLFSLLYNELTR